MATAETGIIKKGEIVSIDLPQWDEALEKNEEFYQQADALRSQALKIAVTDQASYDEAAKLVAAYKALEKETGALLSPYEQVVKKVKEHIQTQKLRVTNALTEIRSTLNLKMGDWTRREQQRAAEEQRREQALLKQKLDREAEEQRKKDDEAAKERRKIRVAEIRQDLKDGKITKRQAEKLLREAGALEEAAKAQAAADEEDAKHSATRVSESLQVEAAIPKAAGVVKRTNYYAEVTDGDAFLKAFIEETVKLGRFGEFRKFVTVSATRLCEEARRTKDSKEMEKRFPGVRAYEEKTF